ncbi:hypothetical protein LO80_02975 [Candidatus Francisella endociliophora]|uniref:ABC-type transport auxiliary lipoprotein component domain-containing protein n=1 Tax=Candidatus Francisella endociliophora TaxID=653937 RepID=A0A097EN98_9GAMM|nr:hypothetical protein [Francisella sp. FSC1006]AIT09039.1 hypothetical protein LO80_02975 [Francisella sp. FSC1006]
MKKYLLLFITILLPFEIFAFSLVGDPVAVPSQKEYIIYSKQIETESLPNVENADIDTTLLIYNIQTQVSKATQMFYIKNHELLPFKNSSWAIPVSKMLTVATFEYILDHNLVSSLAFQDINIRQDFTLSGTTPYGPILDLDNNEFFFYITFYLKNEATGETIIKTFKYHHQIKDEDVNPSKYAELTSTGLTSILSRLEPWLIENLQKQKAKNKATPANNAESLFKIATKQ